MFEIVILIALAGSASHIACHSCGGIIIADKWIVTVAHCTDGESPHTLSIIVGITKLGEEGQYIVIDKIHQHPKDDAKTNDYDIAVLDLKTPIVLEPNAQSISLVYDGFDPSPKSDVVCTGWGVTEEGGSFAENLQKMELQIKDQRVCKVQYETINSIVTDRMICADVPEGGKDACPGDSGGPLVADGKLVQHRSTCHRCHSWGEGCGRGVPWGICQCWLYAKLY